MGFGRRVCGFYRILIAGRRGGQGPLNRRIGGGLHSLTGQCYFPRDGGRFLVFKIQIDGLGQSSPYFSVQQNRGGGAFGLWWSCPAGRGLFAFLSRTQSSCPNFWPVTGHPPLQRELHPTQRQGHGQYLIGYKAHMSPIFFLL